MATFTITTDTNFDDAAFSTFINADDIKVDDGATLTINSDVQWSQTGAYVGNVYTEEGLTVVDGRDVRELKVDSPTGTVPAIGTFLTGSSSGATGEVIGTWTTFPSNNPATAGDAYFGQAYFKLRSVNGAFESGEVVTGGNLTGGTANSADSVGWLLIVQEGSTSDSGGGEQWTCGGLGTLEFRGEWYELGIGDGTPNQTFSHYTTDMALFCEVETGNGTDEWVQYWNRSGVYIKEALSDTEPCFNQVFGNPTMTFENAVIPNGARVRIPNITLATTDATNWATQTRILSTKYGAGSLQVPYVRSPRATIAGNNGKIFLDKLIGSGATLSINNVLECTISNCGFAGRNWVNNVFDVVNIDGLVALASDGAVGTDSPWAFGAAGQGLNCNKLLTVRTSYAGVDNYLMADYPDRIYKTNTGSLNTATSTTGGARLEYISNGSFTNSRFLYPYGLREGSSYGPAQLADLRNVTFTDCEFTGGGFSIQRCNNVSFNNTKVDGQCIGGDFTQYDSTSGTGTAPLSGETCVGSTSGATGVLIYHIGGSSDRWGVKVTSGEFINGETVTFSGGYTLTLVEYTFNRVETFWLGAGNSRIFIDGLSWSNDIPYGANTGQVIKASTPAIDYLRVRNVGSIDSPFDLLNISNNFIDIDAPSNDVKIQRCYFKNSANSTPDIYSLDYGTSNVTVDNIVMYDKEGALQANSINSVIRGVRISSGEIVGAGAGINRSSTFANGTMWFQGFSTDTTGFTVIKPSAINSISSPYVSASAGMIFNNSTGWAASTSGETLEVEMNQYVYGHTGLTDVNRGYGSGWNFQYQIDINDGNGWNGTWKTANSTNLTTESISPTDGYKLKLLVTSTSDGTFEGLSFLATTTLEAQNAALYPFANPDIIFNGVVANTSIAIFRDSDNSFEDYATTDSTSITANPSWNADYSATVRIRHPQYASIQQGATIEEDGSSGFVSQNEYDLVSETDPDLTNNITITNHGDTPVSWNAGNGDKDYSITIQTNSTGDSYTASQLLSEIQWNIYSNATYFGFKGVFWHEMLKQVGTNVETVRGILIGSLGANLKGVRVINSSGNAHPAITRFQADDGTYGMPQVTYSLTLTGLQPNSEVRVYKVSDGAELSGVENSGTTFSFNYEYTSDIAVYIVIHHQEYVYQMIEATLSASDTSIPIQQQFDRNYKNP